MKTKTQTHTPYFNVVFEPTEAEGLNWQDMAYEVKANPEGMRIAKAAPDLLEAAKAAELAMAGIGWSKKAQQAYTDNALTLLRAAIAKAQGEGR